MKSFPKKYSPKDIHIRAKKHTNAKNNQDENIIFSLNELPTSKKLSYSDFFILYLRDFFNYLGNTKKNFFNDSNEHGHIFIISDDQIENIGSCYNFFKKKGQTLSQLGTNKTEKRIISTSKKNINANNKILENYFSSQHKLYMPNSELYLFILNQIHQLRDKGKITKETEIGYRSFNLQTSIPHEYISRKEEKKTYHVLKYFVGAKCEALPVYIEDIDLCCGDVALLVHPKDKRYNKYIGKNAIIPLCNRKIPIIGDENVNIAVNNGIKRICPCADKESIELAKKYGLPTDIYVFNKEGLYTDIIHEHAFIGQERRKYYNNIEGFIEDIGNSAEKGTKIVNIPYFELTGEQLTPYKIDQFVINLVEEKQKILKKIFNRSLKFSFLDSKFGELFEEIKSSEEQINKLSQEENNNHSYLENDEFNEINPIEIIKKNISQSKQKIINEIDKYLPESITLNIQLGYGWKIPFIYDKISGNTSFFNIEKDCTKWQSNSLQICFDFVLLSLVRIGVLGIKTGKNDNSKLCEYDKFFSILSQNEKKIQYFTEYLSRITGDKSDYKKFLHIIQNLNDENDSTLRDCKKLIEDSNFLQQDSNRLSLKLEGLYNDVIDCNFINLCIPCYLNSKDINTFHQTIFGEGEKEKIFKELLIQESILGKTISDEFLEYSYNKNDEFLGDKQLTKLQLEQSQRDLFHLYGENPIRLNFLINQTYDQKEILLNNIFLKQIRNATRLCIQKNFLPKNIEDILRIQPEAFDDDFDIGILHKLNELYSYRIEIQTYEQYIHFFNQYKTSIQDLFFSRYLEIQKVTPTKNVQFVCSYFFNFLMNVLNPLVPEFVQAIQYISDRNFLFEIQPIQLNKSIDYNMNILYNTFIKIKHIKIEYNIKQHESCNIFIKSNPAIGEIFKKYEQIFTNYFHINEINYIRLHEQNPLGYNVFPGEVLTIGLQSEKIKSQQKESIETIERDIKNLDDKLNLLRQRIQILPEGEERKKVEEEFEKAKEEMENLTIKHKILSSK